MRLGALLAALTVAVGVAACGGGESNPPVESMGLVVPGRTGNDLDWTRHAREAFEALADDRGLTGLIADDATAGQIPTAFEQLADRGAELVFANDPTYTAAAARAAEETGVPALVWGNPDALEPGLVGDVEIAAADGGFLAGALAARATGIKSVAALVADDGSAWDARNWNLMAGAFVAGARYAVPDVRVAVRWVGGSDGTTSAEMKRAGEELLLEDRVQTLFALGGRSAIGVLEAVDRKLGEEVYAGVIGDKALANTESDVITSVLYDFDGLFRRAIADVRAGRFGERPYELTFENGGLRLLQTGRTPQDAWEDTLAVQQQLVDGTIEAPQTPTRADVLALLGESSG